MKLQPQIRTSAAPAPPQIDVNLLSGPIGAVVTNLDLRRTNLLDAASTLKKLVAAHHVVFIPRQLLTEDAFANLARQFGRLSVHPLQQLIGRPSTVSVIEDSPSRPPAGFPWHSDLSWLPEPPRYGFLQALTIPPAGGDTMWASLSAAYQGLSPAFRTMSHGLTVRHRLDRSFLESVARNHGEAVAQQLNATHPGVNHPLITAHPSTGEPVVWLSPLYNESINELLPAESALLLAHLHAVVNDPNIAVRWHWSEGDIAIWDETATVHRALIDHHPSSRRMRRCTIEGATPIPFSADASVSDHVQAHSVLRFPSANVNHRIK